MPDPTPLPASRLYRATRPGELGFDTTAELEPLEEILGQSDALAALELGLAMKPQGYNIFVLGESGSGRWRTVRDVVKRRAANEPTPPDRCFVHNFQDARRPRSLELPAGRAPQFRKDLERLIAELRETIPDALASDAVTKRRAALLEEPQAQAAEALDELRQEFAKDEYVALVGSQNAVTVVPARGGEPLDRESYLALPEEMRETINAHVRDATARVASVQRRIQEITREAQERIEELNRDVARSMVGFRISMLKEKYADAEEVVRHLDALCEDVVGNAERFATRPEEAEQAAQAAVALLGGGQEDFFSRYEVNVLVTRKPGTGAPVVEEFDPNLHNLLGRLGLRLQFGTMVADYSRITRRRAPTRQRWLPPPRCHGTVDAAAALGPRSSGR